jgi:hypothetical protein
MRTNKWLFLTIWLTAIIPMVIAWSMAYLGNELDLNTRNHGELAPAGMSVPDRLSRSLNGKWGLIVLSQDCNNHCLEQLYRLRQLHTAMGRDIERIHSIWLSDQPLAAPETLDLKHVATLTEPDVVQWFNEQNLQWQDQGIWLVDPNGILVMRFSPALKGKHILSDLHWLLKTSQVG